MEDRDCRLLQVYQDIFNGILRGHRGLVTVVGDGSVFSRERTAAATAQELKRAGHHLSQLGSIMESYQESLDKEICIRSLKKDEGPVDLEALKALCAEKDEALNAVDYGLKFYDSEIGHSRRH